MISIVLINFLIISNVYKMFYECLNWLLIVNDGWEIYKVYKKDWEISLFVKRVDGVI